MFSPRLRRTTVMLVVLAVGAAACASGDPLSGLGRRSSAWMDQVKPTAGSSTTQPPGPAVVDSEAVPWWNAQLATSVSDDPAQAIAQVHARAQGTDRFVQASPLEIAAALPGIRFPAVVPAGTVSITSQLVFAPGSSLLDEDTGATFGIWSATPYTRSRSVAQRGVLSVAGSAPATAATTVPSCAAFADLGTQSCDTLRWGSLTVWRTTSTLGHTWVWIDHGTRYELFLRAGLEEDTAQAMVLDTIPLADVAAGVRQVASSG